MATDIKAPTGAEGTVAAWHKKPGDSVERDELIVEIETDKVVLEVVAPEAGTLTDVMAEEGDTVESEQILGKIGEGSAAGSKEESSSENSSSERLAAKKIVLLKRALLAIAALKKPNQKQSLSLLAAVKSTM